MRKWKLSIFELIECERHGVRSSPDGHCDLCPKRHYEGVNGIKNGFPTFPDEVKPIPSEVDNIFRGRLKNK